MAYTPLLILVVILALLSEQPVTARKAVHARHLQEVGDTTLPLEGKDLKDFALATTIKAERAKATKLGLVAQHNGEGTAYSDAVPDATGFACARREIPKKAQRMFAAINSDMWDNGENCGKCVQVWCVDSFCKKRFEPKTLMVMDKCPECGPGDLDLSIPAYEEVTGIWPHRLKFEWKFVDCVDEFDYGEKIRMDLKAGPNQWWRAFYFSMNKQRLANVTLDGRPLSKAEFGFWNDWNVLGKAPHKLVLTSEDGQTLEASVDDVMKDTQYLNIQFD